MSLDLEAAARVAAVERRKTLVYVSAIVASILGASLLIASWRMASSIDGAANAARAARDAAQAADRTTAALKDASKRRNEAVQEIVKEIRKGQRKTHSDLNTVLRLLRACVLAREFDVCSVPPDGLGPYEPVRGSAPPPGPGAFGYIPPERRHDRPPRDDDPHKDHDNDPDPKPTQPPPLVCVHVPPLVDQCVDRP